MTEQWRPVVGYEGLYEVSSEGRVRSLGRIDSLGRPRRARILRAASARGGHQFVVLYASDSRKKQKLVHHLVLEAFVGPRPQGMAGLHGNGDPADNRPENLRWGTLGENTSDSVRHGTHFNAAKTRCKYGHPLEAPNLIPTRLRNGKRECLACARSRQLARRRGIPFTRELADARYSLITSTHISLAAGAA